MTNVVRFPASRRIPATTIPREEFERLAELALDVVDRIVALLDETDRDRKDEDYGDTEPSLSPYARAVMTLPEKRHLLSPIAFENNQENAVAKPDQF